MSLLNFYKKAKEQIIREGYQREIEIVENRKFEDTTPEQFFHEYVYVVLNSGMKNQVAEAIYKRFLEQGVDAVKHPQKHRAIRYAMGMYELWFSALCSLSDDGKIYWIDCLPFIGKITKYHLLRNLGIDCAKPDRHMTRLAEIFHYNDVQQMCRDVADKSGDRIGTVDVVLWRYCNLFPSCFETADLCENYCVGDGDYYCDEAICAFVT